MGRTVSLKLYRSRVNGLIHDDPPRIIEAYLRWASDKAEKLAVAAYVSMHGITDMMADHLVGAQADREIMVRKFDLTVTDMGKVAISLVDATTLMIFNFSEADGERL